MDFSVFFEHEVNVLGPVVVTRDAGSGTGLTWPTTRTTAVPCLLKVNGSGDGEQFGQPQLTDTITVATYDTTIQRGDKLVVTKGPTQVGFSLHVQSIQAQPGLDFLGIDPILHITCTRLL